MPQSGQANFSLNNISSSPITLTSANPSPNFKAVSKESVSLPSIPSFIIILSTTASILCFIFFSNFISSYDKSYISPSILALTKQFFFIVSITFS